MKAVILAGGKGSRLSEETIIKPKPLVEIGSKPILWHIMKIYYHYGIKEFIICCGHKGYLIKEYFANYQLHNSDFDIDIKKNEIIFHKKNIEDWKITLVDTGPDTLTGGRILRIKKYISDDFLLTYGDGVANVNIKALIKHHKKQKTIATLTAVQPEGRFGAVKINSKKNLVTNFFEKPEGDNYWINGGFFVLKKDIFKYLKDDNTVWEKEPMNRLVKKSQLSVFKHYGFWHPMDTQRDTIYLEKEWSSNNPPWKIWDD